MPYYANQRQQIHLVSALAGKRTLVEKKKLLFQVRTNRQSCKKTSVHLLHCAAMHEKLVHVNLNKTEIVFLLKLEQRQAQSPPHSQLMSVPFAGCFAWWWGKSFSSSLHTTSLLGIFVLSRINNREDVGKKGLCLCVSHPYNDHKNESS